MSDTGSVIDKDAVRDILIRLEARKGFSPGQTGIEQATNRICALQKPPKDMEQVALTISCDYCGRTAGNSCATRYGPTPAHPSRLKKALAGDPNE